MFRYQIAGAMLVLLAAPTLSLAQGQPESYPITLKADDVHEVEKFQSERNGLSMTGTNLVAVPIRCEKGVTGAMLLGNGEFTFAPADGDEIKGVFRAAMLRFNPTDQQSLLPLDDSNATTDLAVHEMSQHLLNNVFRHCWHSNRNALIPDEGSFVANVYSKTHGDLLISTGPQSTVVYSFSTRQKLYPQD